MSDKDRPLTPEQNKEFLEQFIKEQVEGYKKNTPNAHKIPVPDGLKRKFMEIEEKLQKYKQSPEYKRLIEKYRKKFEVLYAEGGGAYGKQKE